MSEIVRFFFFRRRGEELPLPWVFFAVGSDEGSHHTGSTRLEGSQAEGSQLPQESVISVLSGTVNLDPCWIPPGKLT